MANGELRERVEQVVETPVDSETMANFQGQQKWYTKSEDVVDKVENTGLCVVAAGSCDMVDLLETCLECGWTMREEAAEVFVVEAGP